MLTELSIKALQAPETGAKIYYDDTLHGFGVRITSNGVKSFVLTHGRRRLRKTLGRVGIVTLKDARETAKRYLALAQLGNVAPRSISWLTALSEYMDEVRLKRKKRTADEYDRLLKKYFKLGETKLSDLTADELQGCLNRIKSTEHFHAYTALRAFMSWAHRKHYLDQNPIARMPVPKASKSRDRILTDIELVKVWKAVGDGTFGRIVKLLILTGQRRGEITKLQRGMIRDDRITLPSWLTKNGREHTFPIGLTAKSVLKSQTPSASPSSTSILFRARGKAKSSFNGFSKSKTALDEDSGVTDWTLHDLRRTFASGLQKLGVKLEVIEALLNHVSGTRAGIVGVYQRYNFFPEMKAAIELWDAHVLELLAKA